MQRDDHGTGTSDDRLAKEALRSGRVPRAARARYVAALLAVAVTVPVGNILIKRGLRDLRLGPVDSAGAALRAVGAALSSGWLDLGVGLLIANFVALTIALRYGPLSVTLPIREAASYLGSSVLAVLFLGERMSAPHWAGVVLIFLGVALVGISGEKKG